MPETKEYTVFKFDELSESAKETARDWWRRCEDQDPSDNEFMYDDFERVGALLGIDFKQRSVKLYGGGTRYEPTIWWSGFSSQGDGACFEGTYGYAKGAVKALEAETGGTETQLIAIAKRLQAVQSQHFYKLRAIMTHSGHYYHSGCMPVEVYDERDEYRSVDGAADEIRDCMREFADWMYRQLELEYEYRMADTQVDESITINEYTFDEQGNRED